MHRVLDRLRRDHRNFRRLLELLSAELAVLEQGDSPDLQLIVDVVYYIESYSDTIHHSYEDAVYEVLEERHPQNDTPVKDLLVEHRALRDLTVDVQTLFANALNDVLVDRGQLDSRLASFIEVQRAHMIREEREIFPVLERLLDESDWKLAGQRVPAGEDPLFGVEREERYRALYERLTGDVLRPPAEYR